MSSELPPNVTLLEAASQGNAARVVDGRGAFTAALLGVLRDKGGDLLTAFDGAAPALAEQKPRKRTGTP